MSVVRLAVVAIVTAALLAAGGGAYRVKLAVPATVTAGLPFTAVVHVSPAPPAGALSIRATWAGHRVAFAAAKAGAVFRARVNLPSAPAQWTLTVQVADMAVASGAIRVVEPAVRHPYAVVVDQRGRVFVADGAARRIVLVNPRTGRRSVHAGGFDEPVDLAAKRKALYVADFNAGLVRRVDAAKSVTTLARLPQVTAVAVSPSGAVHAVTMSGMLARISATGRVSTIPVPGGLDRPHGIMFDRNGDILVAEDSRRIRRIDPTSGRAELVVDGVDTNKIAVARDGTLFLAGGSPTGGSLRRLEPGGKPTILFEGLHVSDVALLPGGDLIVVAVEPGGIFRVDPRTGVRRKLAG